MSRRLDAVEIAGRMRRWLFLHSEICEITVPMMQRELGRGEHLPPHVVEQAMQRLNLSGELGHAGASKKTHCCGDCRAARYAVRRKAIW